MICGECITKRPAWGALSLRLQVPAAGPGATGLSVMLGVARVFSATLFLASMYVVGQNSAAGQRGSAYALWNLAV